MNRFLQGFNLLGVFSLATLLVIQWQVNSRVNLRVNDLERIGQEQVAKLAEDDRTIKGYVTDLDEFRERLKLAETQLRDLENKLHVATVERDQLKANLNQWVAAVAARDVAIKQAMDQIQKLAKERNDAIARLNDLTGKYNALVKQWNDQQGK
jgi:chromosome segregation ATPase